MTENELAAASREELIAVIRSQDRVIGEQQAVIAALQVRISALEQKLSGRSGPGMPGSSLRGGRRRCPKSARGGRKGMGGRACRPPRRWSTRWKRAQIVG
jgi:hypothetical protein